MKDLLVRFTPSLMSHETLEAIFVQREKLARSLVERIRKSVLTPSKHHMLLIGPRGMGKTHLVALAYHRVKAMEDLQDQMCIAWLREEEWGVTSFRDLLLRILRALREEYGDGQLAEKMEALYEQTPADAERAAADLLRCYVGERTLLVLIENLDDIFKGLGTKGQQQLRAFLQNYGFVTILATVQSLFNGISLRTSPFYGFFNVHHLTDFDIDDAVNLLTKVAEHDKDDELVAFLQTPKGRARVRAVHHLAGGNPRVYLIFAQFLNREALDDLVEPFMQMLDDLTPYYQSRMQHLSPQQRKIIEFLIENRGAAPVKRIAQRCFLTHQTTTSQLKTLRDTGYVKSESAGRESFYELREPLMRLSIEVKKHRGKPIRLLLDFLRLWYTRPELEEHLSLLKSDAVLEREYVLHALEISGEEAENPLVAACAKDFNKYFEEGDFERALQAAEELVEIRGEASDWLIRGGCLFSLQKYQDALQSFDKAIELNPSDAFTLGERAAILANLGWCDEALSSCNRAIECGADSSRIWYIKGVVEGKLRYFEESLKSLRKAIDLDGDNADAWSWLGLIQHHEDLNEALKSCEKAIELDPDNAWAWGCFGLTLMRLKRHDEALESYRRAIALEAADVSTFFGYTKTLFTLDHWDEGISALGDALSRFAPTEKIYTVDLASLILDNVFDSNRDISVWGTRIQDLIRVYDGNDTLQILGQGLVGSISTSIDAKISKARFWLETWRELASDRDEFQLPLRLLDAAIRYRETEDQRVLLELPAEERSILEEVLGMEESTEA